jgi:hypothetical protein
MDGLDCAAVHVSLLEHIADRNLLRAPVSAAIASARSDGPWTATGSGVS